jgi:hypothetical protein
MTGLETSKRIVDGKWKNQDAVFPLQTNFVHVVVTNVGIGEVHFNGWFSLC